MAASLPKGFCQGLLQILSGSSAVGVPTVDIPTVLTVVMRDFHWIGSEDNWRRNPESVAL